MKYAFTGLTYLVDYQYSITFYFLHNTHHQTQWPTLTIFSSNSSSHLRSCCNGRGKQHCPAATSSTSAHLQFPEKCPSGTLGNAEPHSSMWTDWLRSTASNRSEGKERCIKLFSTETPIQKWQSQIMQLWVRSRVWGTESWLILKIWIEKGLTIQQEYINPNIYTQEESSLKKRGIL